MPNSKESLGNADEMHNAEKQVRNIIAASIHDCDKSREVIADEMTLLIGRRVSVHMLNDYTSQAESKDAARFPAAWVPAFCQVTGDDRLQRQLLSVRMRKLLELAELHLAAAMNDLRKQSLRDELLASMEERGRS